jgi:hypothetical protein
MSSYLRTISSLFSFSLLGGCPRIAFLKIFTHSQVCKYLKSLHSVLRKFARFEFSDSLLASGMKKCAKKGLTFGKLSSIILLHPWWN